jgi:alpha-D-xyloside xylohydrolase
MEKFAQRLNQPPDPREDFLDASAFVFTAQKLENFDPKTGAGQLSWARHRRKPRVAFSHMTHPLEPNQTWEFPPVFQEPKLLPFQIDFVSDRAIRLRLKSREGVIAEGPSLMLQGSVPKSQAWKIKDSAAACTWDSPKGSVVITKDPWSIEIKDAKGKTLLKTHTLKDGRCMITGRPVPFSFVRKSADLSQHIAASFSLFPDEKIYGCGESFSGLNKRGQAVPLWTQDSHGAQTDEMYKPVPFYLSSRGYGVFIHASTPMTLDFGQAYADTQVLYNGHEDMDLFVFLGEPREVLSEYTSLTGRSPLPPLWSFGLWMSRITYESEEQTRGVAAKLQEHRIPCDVIHLDTGWFETDWCCDYRFAPARFKDPEKMIKDLKAQGYHICLWQLPYFTPKNRLYPEILAKGLYVKGPHGGPPAEEVVLDFSNPEAVAWYQKNLEGLLKMGVGAIKVDFGEGAPLLGQYHSGKTGWHEHNLYPLRYNKAASEIGQKTSGYPLIWARSAWAGSQRYPLHWGGDAEATDGGMIGTLRGGLSLGMSGFSFWSHDVGGFFPATPRDLYLRWLPFGMLTSHSRCHGLPPTEPWEFDAAFIETFRKTVEFRYRLMPYIWAQAAKCSRDGHPMLRPLFFEFPSDPTSWIVDDVYMFGSDLLVAPLFEEVKEREIYLPPGEWIDMQSGKSYQGPGWQKLSCGEIRAIILGRGGRVLPMLQSALHTGAQDWTKVELLLLGKGAEFKGGFCPPDQAVTKEFTVASSGQPKLDQDPSSGKITWTFKKLGQ